MHSTKDGSLIFFGCWCWCGRSHFEERLALSLRVPFPHMLYDMTSISCRHLRSFIDFREYCTYLVGVNEVEDTGRDGNEADESNGGRAGSETEVLPVGLAL
jgi:hypothetical protein